MFQVYRKQSDTDIPMFGLPLNALIDCFGLMLPHTNVSKALTETCDIRYNGLGSYLSLKRYDKDHGQTISCNLTPIEPEEEEVDALTGTDIHIQKMILKSDWLISVIGELDKTCESIAFTFSPNDPSFTLRAIGTTGTSETSYPENSDPFISFECDRELTFSYLYSHIIMCKKALEHSVEVSVEMSLNGLLCMLFQIEGSNDTKDFVEFTFLPTGPTID
ncbi:hypothetical protein G6F46_004479 [Rhizopus delemar]|nr:hypothetical protein G6F43_005020 [Rhizopus delemar]KAG1527837.1 hypothetical protein G6F52_001185 [Rhizopus delemar]KAG1617699.1 hypothetical protein G6F46_004479 [Rhizopus delemar]